MRAPPVKRPLLFHLRSIGKRLFSLRLFCFSRIGCRSGFRCTSLRSWCLLLLSCITSLMYGMPRSLWSVEFYIYHGASVIDLSILDWQLCKMEILELLAQPHSSMPYVHMGFMTTLYTRILFARDNGNFLPKSQYNFWTLGYFVFSFSLYVLSSSASHPYAFLNILLMVILVLICCWRKVVDIGFSLM
jgi:hypothetical protein